MSHAPAEAGRSSRSAAGSEVYSSSISQFCLIESIGICYIFVVTCTEYLLSALIGKTDLEKND